MQKKLATFKEIVSSVSRLQKKGKRVALVLGSFDVVHEGHVRLFRFVKRYAEVLVVGLEPDRNIRKLKGRGRPIYKFQERVDVVSEFQSVRYVFPVRDVTRMDPLKIDGYYFSIFQSIQPYYVVVYPQADKFWDVRVGYAKRIGARVLKYNGRKRSSTSKILRMLGRE